MSSANGAKDESPRRRRLYLSIGLLALIAFNIYLFLLVRWRPRGEFPPRLTNPAFEEVEKRIAMGVSRLQKEDPGETVKQLAEVDMYFWPGPLDYGGAYFYIFPLSNEFGLRDVEHVLSNRRFLKSLQELKGLGSAEAAKLVNEALDKGLADYEQLFANYMAENSNYFASGAKFQSGPVFDIGNVPDGRPTLVGARFKLLALALLAGELKLEDCGPTIRELARRAQDQYQRFQREDEFDVVFRHDLMMRGGIYSRQLLAAGLIGTAPSNPANLALLKEYTAKFRSQPATRFDAKSTPFDQHARVGAVDIDFPKDPIVVHYPGELTDEEFVAIVNAVTPD